MQTRSRDEDARERFYVRRRNGKAKDQARIEPSVHAARFVLSHGVNTRARGFGIRMHGIMPIQIET